MDRPRTASDRQLFFNRQLVQLLDAFLIFAAFRAASRLLDPPDFSVFVSHAWILYIVVPFTPLTLEGFGYYRPRPSTESAIGRLLGGICLTALGTVILATVIGITTEQYFIVATGFFFSLLLILARDRVVAMLAKTNCGLR
ncbi:hypothetical protein [Luteolibacter sp. Populi]|uniref:hypothetical protein n=1 Tax=Luteolibacter sp. Populi TaxID=3230487 RepID=UPI003465CE51